MNLHKLLPPYIIHSNRLVPSGNYGISITFLILIIKKYKGEVLKEVYNNAYKRILRHEKIHFKQWLELFIIGLLSVFLIGYWGILFSFILQPMLYLIEYLILRLQILIGKELHYTNLWTKTNHLLAYRNISFEVEAYGNESNIDYLKSRKLFYWIKYIRILKRN